MNQQIEDFGVPYRLDPLPEPDVLLKGGEVFTFGDITVEYIFWRGYMTVDVSFLPVIVKVVSCTISSERVNRI